MEVKKRILSVLLAMSLVFTSVIVSNQNANAQQLLPLQVVINDRDLGFGIPQCVVYEEVPYVYFELIADALGANMEATVWETTTKRMTISIGNTLVILQIGSPAMSIATVKNNEVSYIQNYEMPVVPIIVDDYALVPLEYVITAFGGSYNWNPAANVAYIYYSKPVASTPAPTPIPITPVPITPVPVTPVPVTPVPVTAAPVTPAPITRNPAFQDTSFYQQVSGKRAQDSWSYDNTFALVVFSGNDPNSVARMPAIKEAAAAAGYRIFGVDVDSAEFPNINSLTWVWSYIDRGAPNYPRVLYSYKGDTNAYEVKDITNKELMVGIFTNIKNNVKPTAVPTASPTPTVTPYGTPTPYNWNQTGYNISKNEAISRYNNRETFFYIYYNTSADNSCLNTVQTIVQAAQQAGVSTIYSTDFRYDNLYDWFGAGYFDANNQPNPTLYVIRGGTVYDVYYNFSDYTSIVNFIYDRK